MTKAQTTDLSAAFSACQAAIQPITFKLKRLMVDTVATYIDLGRELAKAKKRLPHGEYGKLLDAEGLSKTTAYRCRTLFEHRKKFNPHAMGQLTLAEAEDLIKAENTVAAYYEAPDAAAVRVPAPRAVPVDEYIPRYQPEPKPTQASAVDQYVPKKVGTANVTVAQPVVQNVEVPPFKVVPPSSRGSKECPTQIKTFAQALRKQLQEGYARSPFVAELDDMLFRLIDGER